MIRTGLVGLCVLAVLLILLAMARGWRNRLGRQWGLPPAPEVPAGLGAPRLRASGLYVGTTFATSWQDRVAHEHLGERASATALLHDAGVVFDREGGTPVFLPRDAIVSARLAPGLAGKVVGAGGLLVLRWRLGGVELDTGFRADEKTDYPAWVRAVNEGVPA